MLTRIITSLVAVCVLIPALLLSNTIVFPVAIAVVAIISLYEIFKCFGYEKKWAMTTPLYLIAAAAPACVRYIKNPLNVAYLVMIAAVVYGIYLFALIVWSHGTLPFGNTVAMFLLSMYIIAALSAIVFIRDFGDSGKYIYLLIFIGAWFTDIFAYFTGYFLGKHKLIEDVSPKKTIEGSIGGIVFCALGFVGLGVVVDVWFGQEANLLFLAICGVIISLISQIGDLIMSVIKRHYGIKDFGKIFPGHGGMLDRFDSILAVSLGLCAVCMFSAMTGISLM